METAIRKGQQSGKWRTLSKTHPPRYYNLRLLMLEQGVDQGDIAVLTHHSRPYISDRMTGKKTWAIEDMECMARAFDLPVSEWMHYFYDGELK